MKSYLCFTIILFLLLLSACGTTPTLVTTSTTVPASTIIVKSTNTPTPISTETLTSTATSTPLPLLTVKLISYNILYGAGVDREFDNLLLEVDKGFANRNRLPEFMSYIKNMNPDILGIQEASGWDKGNPSVIQMVADELGMNYFLANAYSSPHHIAILSKFEIMETENLSKYLGDQGGLRVTAITQDGQPINIIVVHLDHDNNIRRFCQTSALVQLMQPYWHQTVILMGDMNSHLGWEELNVLEQAGMEVVAIAGKGIDQIWISPSVNWSKTEWFYSFTASNGISDHRPVGAEINIFPTLGTDPITTPAPHETPTNLISCQ